VSYQVLRTYIPTRLKRSERITKADIRRMVASVNASPLVKERLKDIHTTVTIFLPWTRVSLAFDQGVIVYGDGRAARNPDLTVSLTQKGYQGIMQNQSLSRLYLKGDIKLEGDLSHIRKNKDVFFFLLEEFKKIRKR
jgi:hypothetical protein